MIVIGCPGSGKSTFSRALHQIIGIPLFHLDMIYWNSDKTTVDKATFHHRLSEIMAQDEWIIDGNYSSTMELRMKACDTIMFLDYPQEVCLSGVQERKGKMRSDLPWAESSEDDEEFIAFIRDYKSESRPKVMDLLDQYSDREIHVFSNRKDADGFLTALKIKSE